MKPFKASYGDKQIKKSKSLATNQISRWDSTAT